MNIFNEFEEKLYAVYAKLSKQHDFPSNLDLSKCVIELPRDETHGDLACNAALVLAKPLNYPPRKLAELIAKELEKDDSVLATEIAKVYCDELEQVMYPEVVASVEEYLRVQLKNHAEVFYKKHKA